MPVKLDLNGQPLGEGGQPAPMQVAAPSATDALLAQTAAEPQQNTVLAATAGEKPVLAHAETGELHKDGGMTMLTSEQIVTGFTIPAGYGGPVGKVTYGMAATINTGNYENMRPFVQIEVPFVPGYQDDVYEFAYQWVDARLSGIVQTTQTAVKGA